MALGHTAPCALTCTQSELLIWDAASGALSSRRAADPELSEPLSLSQIYSRRLSLNSKGAIALANQGSIKVWSDLAQDVSQTYAWPAKATIYMAVLSSDGRYLAGGGLGGLVWLWDLGSGAPPRKLAGHGQWLTSAAFSADGARLVTLDRDARGGALRIWNTASGALERTAPPKDVLVFNRAIFTPSGKRVLTLITGVGSFRYYDRASGAPLRTFATKGSNSCLAPSLDGAQFALGKSKSVGVFETASGKELDTVPSEASDPQAALSPDHQALVVYGDRRLELWRRGEPARKGAAPPALPKGESSDPQVLGTQSFPKAFPALAFESGDEGIFASEFKSPIYRLRRVAGQLERVQAFGPSVLSHWLGVTSAGDTLIQVDREPAVMVRLYDAATGKERKVLKPRAKAHSPEQVALASSGRWLAVAFREPAPSVQVFDLKKGALKSSIPLKAEALAVHPSAPQVLLASFDANMKLTVELRNLMTGKQTAALRGVELWAAAGFSRKGKLLFGLEFLDDETTALRAWSVSNQKVAWSLSLGKEAHLPRGYSPDGRWLALEGDKRLKLVDLEQRKVHLLLKSSASGLAFSHDGRRCAVSDLDATEISALPGRK